MEHMLDSIYKMIVWFSSSRWWGFFVVFSILITNYIFYKNPELKKFRKKIGFVFAVYGIGLFICLILAAQFPWDTISMILDNLAVLFIIAFIILFIYIIIQWIKLRRQKKISKQ